MIKLKNKSLQINITIHDEFPKHTLIDAFKLFYKYHYISLYSFNEHKRFVHYFELNKKLIFMVRILKIISINFIILYFFLYLIEIGINYNKDKLFQKNLLQQLLLFTQ